MKKFLEFLGGLVVVFVALWLVSLAYDAWTDHMIEYERTHNCGGVIAPNVALVYRCNRSQP